MCFFISEKFPVAKEATKDIVCYKVVSTSIKGYASLCINFPYRDNKTYSLKKVIYDDFKTKIYKDHNYIEEGFHSYTTKKFAKAVATHFFGRIVIKCIIPKEAFYFKNENRKEYVSTQIKIVGKV